jgi:hypothetical protein
MNAPALHLEPASAPASRDGTRACRVHRGRLAPWQTLFQEGSFNYRSCVSCCIDRADRQWSDYKLARFRIARSDLIDIRIFILVRIQC